MKRIPFLALLILLLASPPTLSGQGFAVGARAGSLGLGGEVALGLSDMFVIRGGVGFFPFEFDQEIEGFDWSFTFPTAIWSAGVDLYLAGGPIRLMGGIMGRSGDLSAESPFDATREIGDNVYTTSGVLKGTLAQKSVAPFAGIGFGKHTEGGFGFFLDLAVAFTGEPDMTITATGPVAQIPGIREELDREADEVWQEVKDEAGSYINYWPILSIGIKLPLSGGF